MSAADWGRPLTPANLRAQHEVQCPRCGATYDEDIDVTPGDDGCPWCIDDPEPEAA